MVGDHRQMNLNNAGDMIVIKDEQGNVFLCLWIQLPMHAGLDLERSIDESPDIEGISPAH